MQMSIACGGFFKKKISPVMCLTFPSVCMGEKACVVDGDFLYTSPSGGSNPFLADLKPCCLPRMIRSVQQARLALESCVWDQAAHACSYIRSPPPFHSPWPPPLLSPPTPIQSNPRGKGTRSSTDIKGWGGKRVAEQEQIPATSLSKPPACLL